MNRPAEKMNEQMTLNDLYQQAGVQGDTHFAKDIWMNEERIPEAHQVRNLNSLLVNSYWGLFDEPGTMKTLPAQAYGMYMAGHGHKVLVVMPPVVLKQFREAMTHTFLGFEDQFTMHTLREGPYPVKISKKRVQAVKALMWRNYPVPEGIPKGTLKIIDALKTAMPISFTQADLNYIRRTKGQHAAKVIAAELGCSTGAVLGIRRDTFREDLYAKWAKDNSWPDFLIMSYQMYYRAEKHIRETYRVVIADEAHALCHPSSTTWRKMRDHLRMTGGDSAFIPMTGTPCPNVPTDYYGLIKLLNPKAYGTLSDFKFMHCVTITVEDQETGRRFEKVVGYKNLDVLRTSLYARASRVTKEQVFTLEKPSIFEREVDLSDDHYELYRRLVRERVLEVDGEIISAVQAQSLRQKVLRLATHPDPFTDKHIKDNAVRAELEELLDEIGCEHKEKVVIFAIYNNSIKAMAEWFKHLNPALVYGKSNKEKNIDKFLNDDSCRLMIAHYKSGGVGLNLQGVCRYVICAEPTAIPGDFLQAVERVYRKGQTKHVTFYILRVLRTVWPKMVDNMRGKLKLTTGIQLDKSEMLSELLGET